MGKILIIGSSGQLGMELSRLMYENGINYIGTSSRDLDITNKDAVESYFDKNRPKVVFDCAAYTNVDGAEEDPGKAVNYNVNVDGTRNVAEFAEKVGAILIYISTDYIFDGTNEGLYTEEDIPKPRNEYGCAKLQGEQMVSKIMSKYYIVRTSWVFGKYGNNFVKTMLKLSETHNYLKVVDDQIGRPTWTRTLAEFMLFIIDHNIDYGIYHLSNDGHCSWYEFAREILRGKDMLIEPVTSKEYPQKAYRPKHSVMSLKKVKSTGFQVPMWNDALREYRTTESEDQ